MAGRDDWGKQERQSYGEDPAKNRMANCGDGSRADDNAGDGPKYDTGTGSSVPDHDNGNSYKCDWLEQRRTGETGGSSGSEGSSGRNTGNGDGSSWNNGSGNGSSDRNSGNGDAGSSWDGGKAGSNGLDGGDKKSGRKKGSTGKGILIGILIVLIPVLTLTGVGAYVLHSSGSHLEVVSDSDFDMSAIESKLNLIQSVIDSCFLFDYDKDELAESIYAGYVEGLGDPYTCYYTEEEYKDMMESSEGTYYGIGVMISQEVDTGRVYVIRVFSGSPAEEAGMKEGDIIAEVEGKEATGMDLNEVVAAIKGAEGTTAKIKIYRESEKQELTLDVERRQVDVDTVYYRMLDNNIGYLELTEFDSVSTNQFISALEDLKSQGMEALVLDLRNNPGGMLDVAVSIADELIDTGTVVTIRDKAGNEEAYTAEEEGSLGIPLAVLVNGDSASASEVLSGCIRDYDAGILVGTQTFGKGIVQNIIPFTDGTAMKITTAHYYTPNGTDIHGVGITPDIVVEDDKATEDVDEQLEAAIDALMKDRQ
ncbi:MAG: S41 family peptidase [Lachnospiraceae bacterium]